MANGATTVPPTEAALTTPQIANIAEDIAVTALAIRQLSVLLDVTGDRKERGALALAIGCMATHAGSLADLVNTAQGAPAVVGGFAEWFTPEFLSR